MCLVVVVVVVVVVMVVMTDLALGFLWCPRPIVRVSCVFHYKPLIVHQGGSLRRPPFRSFRC